MQPPASSATTSPSSRPTRKPPPSPAPASASPTSTRWAPPAIAREPAPIPRAEPPRAAIVDPRTKAGAYGEQISGPHKPTLDEMGPHAERGLPVDAPRPPKPIERGSDPSRSRPDTLRKAGGEGSDPLAREKEKRGRRGRPRKTGRPGA